MAVRCAIFLTHNSSLCGAGKTTLPRLAPLALNRFAAAEVVGGLPLGASAVRDSRLEMLVRRLRWLQTLAHHTGLVGTLHRRIASASGCIWTEPSPALAQALSSMSWRSGCNLQSVLVQQWPVFVAETRFAGQVRFLPGDGSAPPDAVWTDGSLGTAGRGGGGSSAPFFHSESAFCAWAAELDSL